MNCGLIEWGQFQFYCVIPAEVHTTDLYYSSRVKWRKCGAIYCTWSPRIKVWQLYLHTYICTQTNNVTWPHWMIGYLTLRWLAITERTVCSDLPSLTSCWDSFTFGDTMVHIKDYTMACWWVWNWPPQSQVSARRSLGYHSQPSTFGRITPISTSQPLGYYFSTSGWINPSHNII